MNTPLSNSYCWAPFIVFQGEAVISRNKNHPAVDRGRTFKIGVLF